MESIWSLRLFSCVNLLMVSWTILLSCCGKPAGGDGASPSPSQPTATMPTSTISVSSLTLIDIDTNQPISQFNPIASGSTINLATLPSHNLTIQANTSPATIGSVAFDLVNSKYLNTVNTAPYDLCGTAPCSNLSVGLHSLTIKPYMASNASGGAGRSMSISFSIIDPTPTPIATPSPTPTPTSTPITRTTTLVLTSANNGQTFNNYRISTTSGPCVSITGASNITIENSNIGPCGQNNSDNDSTGIEMSGGSGINIYDSYIHVETEANTNSYSQTHSHSDIEAGGRSGSGTTNVTIQGNIICFGAADIRAESGSNGWVVNGNYLCNPTGRDGSGNEFQVTDSWNETVENNYVYNCLNSPPNSQVPKCGPGYVHDSSNEDAINFYYDSSNSTTDGTVIGNYMFGNQTGPNDIEAAGSFNGCNVEADQNAYNLTVTNNTMLQGTGICDDASGPFHASGNKVWSNNVSNSKIVASYDNNHTGPCVWQNNTLTTHGGGTNNNYYWAGNSPTCSSFSGYVFSGNIVGAAADTALGLNSSMTAAQVMAQVVPPLIPPMPKNCAVKSPYTTQTSKASCP